MPPMTMSNGLSASPFSARHPRRNITSSRTSLTSGERAASIPAMAGMAPSHRAARRIGALFGQNPPTQIGTRGPSVAGQDIRLGGRKLAACSCRDEVAAALSALTARDSKSVFTVREVYAEMVASGTRYAESIVFKTMQRMKGPVGRLPYMRLERVEREGFRIELGA
jgi:hypothetical protein